jgi:hypothetical protein
MKKLGLIAILLTLASACSKPVEVEIKDVCSKPEGTGVIFQGFISLPREMEITKYTRGGQGAGITYKLFMMTKSDASGDAVATVFSGTSANDKNRVKMFPAEYTWNDLLVFTENGEEVRAGKIVKVTGEIAADEKNGCKVNVSKIELP